jgi:hypothetical protein
VTSFEVASDGAFVVYRSDELTGEVFELFWVDLTSGAPAPAVRISADMVAGGDVQEGYGVSAIPDGVAFLADQDTDGVNEAWLVRWIDGEPQAPVKVNAALVAGGNCTAVVLGPHGMGLTYLADQEADEDFELFFVDIVAHSPQAPVRVNEFLPVGGDVQDGHEMVVR